MSGTDLLYIDTNTPPISKPLKSNGTIYEWYPWSYFNVIFGCLILGFIAIFFSFRTTMHKEADNARRARLWSFITLFWNLFATSAGLALTCYALMKD